MHYVDIIVNAPRDANDNPLQKIEMFITRIGSNDTVPMAPVLKAPLSGSVGTTTTKSLQWFAVNDAIIYQVQVATDSLFTNIFKTADVGAPTASYTVTGLTVGKKYYWRVKTNNGGHFSTYSQVWNFYISAVGIEDINNENNLITVAPNPSNGEFTFYNLEKDDVIEIFDVTGRSIYKVMATNNTAIVNLQSHPKGIYFYSVINSDKKMVNGKLVLN